LAQLKPGDDGRPLTEGYQLPSYFEALQSEWAREKARRLPWVLEGVSFEAQPNQVIALLGMTGSGKSTIINLIPRFYDVTAGCVTVDGVDVRDVELHSLRQQIGIVLQDPLLFSATIRDNIAYGRPAASADEVIAAARAARAHGFVMAFPDGYDTLVGERGVTLSGGQRQRVAIARALVTRPALVLADEPTANLDSATGASILQLMRELNESDQTTFLFSTHDPDVMERARRIVRLVDGRLASDDRTHRPAAEPVA
jgi:ATP-binding cassette subfamily B protein